MSQIFEIFTQQQRELERYRTKFGPLPDSDEDAGDDQQPNGLGSSVTAPTSRRLMTP